MKTRIILLLLATFYMLLPVQSQVTIGSVSAPRNGSLLELKENENADDNSKKGFSLPRVDLESPAKLTLDDDSKGEEYKGLTVYNTNPSGGLTEGVYCWDGKLWKLVVAVKDEGMDGQILTSKGGGSAPEWKNQAEMNIPTIDLVGDKSASAVLPANTITSLAYNMIYMNDFTYNNGAMTPAKSGYYQINVYNKMDVSTGTTGETENRGIAITKLCLRQGTSSFTYKDLLSFSAFYPIRITIIHQTLSGLVYLTAGQNYVIRTTYEKKFKILGGRITFTYLGN